MLRIGRRRLFLGLAFLGALTAAMMAPSEEVARPQKRAVKGSAASAAVPMQSVRKSSRELEVPPLLSFERHIDEKFVVVDVFEPRKAPAPAQVLPEAPLPPKLPFAYMGRVEEAGRVKYVLTEGENLHVVAKGEKFAASYRLDEVGVEEMVLTYLPLDVRQSLSIGGVSK